MMTPFRSICAGFGSSTGFLSYAKAADAASDAASAHTINRTIIHQA